MFECPFEKSSEMLSTQPELSLDPLARAVPGVAFEPGSKIGLPSLLVPAGPELACAIGALVLVDLTPAGHIEVAVACQRLSRWAAGAQLVALAEYGRTQVWSGEPEARDDPKGVRAKQYGAADLDALKEFADREVSCARHRCPVRGCEAGNSAGSRPTADRNTRGDARRCPR